MNNPNAYLRKQGAYIEMKKIISRAIFEEGIYEWDVRWLKKDGLSQNDLAKLSEEIDDAESDAYDKCDSDRDEDSYRDCWVAELMARGWEQVQMSFSYSIGERDVQI